MRGNPDNKYANERLRSAYAGVGGINQKQMIQVQMTSKNDTINVRDKSSSPQRSLNHQAASVNYEQLSGMMKPPNILNPQNLKNMNRFGFAQMHPPILH